MRRVTRLALVLCTTITSTAIAQAGPAGVRDSVPADLRSLLAPHRSEMRLVTLRYSQDRTLLLGNYPGAAGGRGGRGGGAAPDSTLGAPIVVSANRIARLKEFDSNWQRALTALDASKLTPPARVELDSLKGVAAANIGHADPEAKDLERRLLFVFPSSLKLVRLLGRTAPASERQP